MCVLKHLVVLLVAVTASGLAQKVPEDPTLVYIGTHTGDKSKGIYYFRLQSQGDEVFQNVTLVPLGLAAELSNPTYIELDLKRRVLFAVSESEPGSVSAFAIDQAGKLTLLNQQPSGGSRPCQLALDKSGRYLLIANCGSGSITLQRVQPDGRLDAHSTRVDAKTTSSPCAVFDPEGRFVFVCNTAADRVDIYRLDDNGTLTPNQPAFVSLKAGSAPQRIVFRQDGRFAYVVNAKASTITVFAYDAATGALREVQSVATVPEYFDGPNTAGELGIHRSGRWLYVSNSGHNSVVLFTIDKEKGTLTFVEEQGTGGKNPRFFGIEPASKHLAISNTDSDTVLASRIDDGNGRLKPSGIFASLASPASVRFLPPMSAATEK